MSGWRAVSTDLVFDDVFRDNDEVVAWLLMFGRYARSQPTDDMRRGQFDCSMSELARRLQQTVDRSPNGNPKRWTRDTARAFCRKMKRHGALDFEAVAGRRGVTRFTILNYEKWQKSGPCANHARTMNGPTQTQAPSASQNGANHEWPTDGPPMNHDRDTRSKIHEVRDRDVASDSPASSKLVDDRGCHWPPLPKSGGLRKLKQTPETFELIWSVWRRAAKVSGVNALKSRKAETYGLIRGHLVEGNATGSEVLNLTKRYLKRLADGGTLEFALRPPTFYARQDAPFLDELDETDSSSKPATPKVPLHILFQGPAAMGLQYAQIAAERLGAEPVQTDATCKDWRVYNALPANVRELAENLARFGFKYDHTQGAA